MEAFAQAYLSRHEKTMTYAPGFDVIDAVRGSVLFGLLGASSAWSTL